MPPKARRPTQSIDIVLDLPQLDDVNVGVENPKHFIIEWFCKKRNADSVNEGLYEFFETKFPHWVWPQHPLDIPPFRRDRASPGTTENEWMNTVTFTPKKYETSKPLNLPVASSPFHFGKEKKATPSKNKWNFPSPFPPPKARDPGLPPPRSIHDDPPTAPSSPPPQSPTPSAVASAILKRPLPSSDSGSSSGPALSVQDASMDLEYADPRTPRPSSPASQAPTELMDVTPVVQSILTMISEVFEVISQFSKPKDAFRTKLLARHPALMDSDVEGIYQHFLDHLKDVSPSLGPLLPQASSVAAPAAAAESTHGVPRNADKSHPKKKIRVQSGMATGDSSSGPAPANVAPATAPGPMVSDVPAPAAPPPPASGKAPPVPIPATSKRPSPRSAPPVSYAAPAHKRRRGKHTVHGASRRGLRLTPPAGSTVTAASFTPDVLNDINAHLKNDLKSKVVLTHSLVDGNGVFIAASQVPSSAEIGFVLKHVRRLFPSATPIAQAPITSTSYLKMVDIPHVPSAPSGWANAQHEALYRALRASPVGVSLLDVIKHKPRYMRVSPHSDSVVAWIDIQDSVSGARARDFISKVVVVGGRNCRIMGARPHAGTVLCSRCQRWGHHASQCRAKSARCALCGGPHFTDSHRSVVDTSRVDHTHCVNCTAAKRPVDKRAHAATDIKKCPFWQHRYDRDWLQRQFPPRG